MNKLLLIRRLLTSFLLTFFVCTVGAAQTSVPLGPSTVLDATLESGDQHKYTVQLKSGESARVVILQQGIDLVVDLISPGGKVLDEIDSPTGRTGEEIVDFVAAESGAFTLRVRGYDQRESGKYRIEVRALRSVADTQRLLAEQEQERRLAAQWLRARGASLTSPALLPRTLAPFDEPAKRVRVLGIGEATHGSREFGDLRLSLTRRLIERHGYRVVALEGSTSLNAISAYVNGSTKRTPAITRVIDSIWIGRRARRELIDWVRLWNVKHPKDRVRVIGVDAQENSESREILRNFIGRAYSKELMDRWTAAERELAAADEQTAVFGDSGVDPSVRQLLVELTAMLDLDAPILVMRFGQEAVQTATEAAHSLLQFADFNSDSQGLINHSRDWYMAANVLRALEQAGPASKAVFWAHNAHVAHPPGSDRTAGAVLRSVLGCKYSALAVTFGEGAFVAQIPNDLEDRLTVSTVPRGSTDSVEEVLSLAQPSGGLFTWTCNPTAESLPEWIRRPHVMHWVGALYTPGSVISAAFRPFNLVRDFDGVVYLPRVSADDIPQDRPIIPARRR